MTPEQLPATTALAVRTTSEPGATLEHVDFFTTCSMNIGAVQLLYILYGL